MKYLLDFDHTLMDTEALKTQAFNDGSMALVGTVDFWKHHNVMDFLFSDVREWIMSKPKESLHILTAFKPSQGPNACAFQETKIASGGFSQLVSSVTVMEGEKGRYAVKIAKQFSPLSRIVFIDDRPDQCASVKSHLPDAHCFLMVRYNVCPSNIPDGVTPVYSLAEVDATMESLV
ncbi:MAG: hypothetical protein KBB78_01740 [Candidatus Pacebacteria bacterium]|nr:hypothetical protein [Candidatus Paceibacterota bacterium]